MLWWSLLLIALAAFAMYSVVYVEGRYVAVFVVLFWTDWLIRMRMPPSRGGSRAVVATLAISAALLGGSLAAFNLRGALSVSQPGRPGDAAQARPAGSLEVARELQRLGLGSGEPVVVVAEDVPRYADMTGWQQIGDTSYYVLRLRPRALSP